MFFLLQTEYVEQVMTPPQETVTEPPTIENIEKTSDMQEIESEESDDETYQVSYSSFHSLLYKCRKIYICKWSHLSIA